MLAYLSKHGNWKWVARRDRGNNCVITTDCKEHSLGAEDLEYFRYHFPDLVFTVKE